MAEFFGYIGDWDIPLALASARSVTARLQYVHSLRARRWATTTSMADELRKGSMSISVSRVTADGESLRGWWIKAQTRRRGHLLFFHGNGEDASDCIPYAELLTGIGR